MFFFGILGIFITRKNIIIILVSIELMLLAVNFNFAIFSVLLEDLLGQVFILYVLTLAGAEAAIGLAILIIFYRIRGIIAVNFVTSLKG
jgi:NADH:ubiquinone oxidoreductase subunit K